MLGILLTALALNFIFLFLLFDRLSKIESRLDVVEFKKNLSPPAPPPEKIEPIQDEKPLPEEEKKEKEEIITEPKTINEPAIPLTVEKPKEREELEVLIGGNWLNKIGAFVLVIGIALFLAYSLKYIGPMGKIILGVLVSLGFLGSGLFIEDKEKFTVFARGLIAAGWGGLYFTTYAMFAFDASRIIYNPVIASMLLLAVAAMMVLHALKYKNEQVVALSYFITFITLAIIPTTWFAGIALSIMLISLLIVASRFNWNGLAIFGVIAAYSIYLLKISGTGESFISYLDFIKIHNILLINWLAIEAFDLIQKRNSDNELDSRNALFPLNLLGVIGISLLILSSSTASIQALHGTIIAAAFTLSAIIRFFVNPKKNQHETTAVSVLTGFEGAVTAAALCYLYSIFKGFTGTNLVIALTLEAECLFILGMFLGNSYLRSLSLFIFFFPVLKTMLSYQAESYRYLSGLPIHFWSPLFLLLSATAYLNYGIPATILKDKLKIPDRSFSYLASFLLAALLAIEFPHHYIGISLLIMAIPLFEIDEFLNLKDFRIQSFFLFIIATMIFVFNNVAEMKLATPEIYLPVLAGAIILYAYFVRIHFFIQQSISKDEKIGISTLLTGTALLLLGLITYLKFPANLINISSIAMALILIEVGFFIAFMQFRIQGFILAVIIFLRGLLDCTRSGLILQIPERLLIVAPVIIFFYFLAIRYRLEKESKRLAEWEQVLRLIYTVAAVLLLVALLYAQISIKLVTVAWGISGVLLLIIGFLLRDKFLRLASLVLLLICIMKLFLYDLSGLDIIYRIISFIVLGVLLLGVSWGYTQFREKIRDYLIKD
ncbi:DUF2339 domain-containing protein [Candidatus Margulisiibacteriota bacterium]